MTAATMLAIVAKTRSGRALRAVTHPTIYAIGRMLFHQLSGPRPRKYESPEQVSSSGSLSPNSHLPCRYRSSVQRRWSAASTSRLAARYMVQALSDATRGGDSSSIFRSHEITIERQPRRKVAIFSRLLLFDDVKHSPVAPSNPSALEPLS